MYRLLLTQVVILHADMYTSERGWCVCSKEQHSCMLVSSCVLSNLSQAIVGQII